jgi:hypothetical protein
MSNSETALLIYIKYYVKSVKTFSRYRKQRLVGPYKLG